MGIEISKRLVVPNTEKTLTNSDQLGSPEVEAEKSREREAVKVRDDKAKEEKNKTRLKNILEELSETNFIMDTDGGIFADNTIDIEQSLSKDSPIIIKGLSAILMSAVETGATDIHIEAYEDIVRVRYRIDGELIEVKRMSKSILNALVSRVKILSNLDIAERRLPQDGRMKMKILSKDIDFRIAIMPTIYGEKVAIRILDKSSVEMRLEKLGFTENEYEKVSRAINAPHGIILVTGPTGSGKSTTLYAILNKLNTPNVNISTVEDPVEYNLQGVNQVQAKPEIGLSFAAALRQFLRQDPDIIMLGEIRDNETAEIAIKAALTGHLVLSTLHTNDAVSSIFRLANMGVEKYLISAAMEMVMSQRLLRRLCVHCKKEDEEFYHKLKVLGVDPEEYKDKTFYQAGGVSCPYCNSTGYKGRLAVHEIFMMTEEIRIALDNNAALQELEELAKKQGMVSIKRDGLAKCLEGTTSLDEVIKTCQ